MADRSDPNRQAPIANDASHEDSGVYDLRALATSTKDRATARRSSTSLAPPPSLSASGSMRAMVLPKVAQSISLPHPGQLPGLPRTPRATLTEFGEAAPVRRAPWLLPTAIVAAGAFVGGAVIYVQTRATQAPSKDQGASRASQAAPQQVATEPAAAAQAAASLRPAAATAAVPRGSAPESSAQAVALAQAVAPAQAVAGAPTVDAPRVQAPAAQAPHVSASEVAAPRASAVSNPVELARSLPPNAAAKPATAAKAQITNNGTSDTPATAAPADAAAPAQSLDDLLREAGGVEASPGVATPENAKSGLTREEIASAMGAVAARAQACYQEGQAGNVGVRLAVNPSGKVTKSVATGKLAGTEVGDCVAKAASGAVFPTWSGRPITVNYAYLLTD